MKIIFEMKKINNKILLIIFSALALLVLVIYFYDRNRGERTFKRELFSVDSSRVTAICIYPKGQQDSLLKLVRKGKAWEIQYRNKTYPADTTVIRQIISALVGVKPERVAATDQSSYKDFEITDSASVRVTIKEGSDVTADFRVGKISFSQGNAMQGYGRNRNMSVKSHIRVDGDEKVYVVDGFLSMMFSDQPALYRNRLVCRFDKNLPVKMTFTYPGDSSFIMEKQGTRWLLNGQPADSIKTETFLGSLANVTNGEFAGDNPPSIYPYVLKIEGNSMPDIEVYGAMDVSSKEYFVKSALNAEAVFASSTRSLFNQFFPEKARFMVSKAKPGKK